MASLYALILLVIAVGFLAYHRFPLWVWTAAVALAIGAYTTSPHLHVQGAPPVLLWLVFAIIAVPLNLPWLRRMLITDRLLAVFRKILPTMSRTEQEALEAGSVWWDAELFSGNPNWRNLLNYPVAQLRPDEQAFIDGPADELCSMLDDWAINHESLDLPPEVWQFLKDNRFFGMIIPQSYGGLGFSALAHSTVVMKIASRSVAAAVTVMVPNSLGPAELLLHYGTPEQKDHYLPRLATAEEIPCFALTSPEAGSDAGGIPDYGVVCKGEFNGQKDVLGIRVTWEKRYITLGPVATLLGLAFNLHDPDHLIGEVEDRGITCALIPTDHPGVEIGRRHYPSGIAFQNGPNSGRDVFIPIDWIIGGVDKAGQGWRMLMECLGAGRSISLPALSVGASKFTSRTMGAYARVRKQFRTPIGYFEGVEEPLTRIGANAYMMDAARVLTAAALDQGESPSVLSAILKYNLTERMRMAVNDAMDIQGGAGICLGPHNILGKLYHALPIGITVEGANILTRSMIIFGQGAIRCHPYVLPEMQAAASSDRAQASRQFDEAFTGHVGFTLSNVARSLFLGLTGARLSSVPVSGPSRRYLQAANRYSAAFALAADAAMLTLGGALKRKEKISGRFADVLSLLYLLSATVKQFEDNGRNDDELPLMRWSCEDALYRIQEALHEILRNLPNRPVAWILRGLIFPLGRHRQAPRDELGQRVARFLLSPSAARDRLTAGIHVPEDLNEPLGRLEYGIQHAPRADEIEKKLHVARKNGLIDGLEFQETIDQAVQQDVISQDDAAFIQEYNRIRRDIIAVDDFDATFGMRGA